MEDLIANAAAAADRDSRATKGEETRRRIVCCALDRVSLQGLRSLSIGELATALGMSKSGLFSHFGSKEALQKAVLEEMLARFVETVITPARAKPHGLMRLRATFDAWLKWVGGSSLPGGCPILAASFELDDQPGPHREYLAEKMRSFAAWLAKELRYAAEQGEIVADADVEQVAFELDGIVQSFAYSRRLIGDPQAETRARAALERLLAHPPLRAA